MPGEDRLTEIFAFVLSRDAALVRELCARAGVPFGADYRVATQRLTRDGDFADMEIVLHDAGRQVALLLFEHKDDPMTDIASVSVIVTSRRARFGGVVGCGLSR